MYRNYVNIALRNIAKYKVFSLINIGGMAISLASAILITVFVWDELSYDSQIKDGERVFRVYNINGQGSHLPIVPYPYASYMQKDFPEVESTLRLMDTYSEQLFEVNEQRIMEGNGVYAEPGIFDMLSLDVTSGNKDNALQEPYTVALSQSLATKYFGDKNPVGEAVKINQHEARVTAVFATPPDNFHLKLNYIVSLATTGWAENFQDNWRRQQIFTYLKLRPGSDAKALEAKLLPFVEKYAYPILKPHNLSYVPYLQNVRDIHLHSSQFEWEIAQRGNAQSIYILIMTGIAILVIASLNFINLSTSRSVKRMKEVGVRKVVGAQRRQLTIQFVSESVILTLGALFVAAGIAQLTLPLLNNIIDKELHLQISVLTVAGAVGFSVMLGILAGSYPAFVLSRFRPALALWNKSSQPGGGAAFLRQSLVVVQFMLSFLLIVGSWIVLEQNDLLRNGDIGFDKEQVVVIPLKKAQLLNQETTKQLYIDNPSVVSATIGYGLPGDIAAGDGVRDPVTETDLPTTLYCVDVDYISTMGMSVIAGRDFSRDFPSDSSEAFILNETAAKTFGFGTPEEAVGKALDWDRWDNGEVKHGKVIGVVKDFYFKSLREELSPVVLQIFPNAAWKMAVRIKPTNISETIGHLKSVYEKLSPEWAFTYFFMDEKFEAMYTSEVRLGKLFSAFTYLTIAVACLGLFGLVEYSINLRTKEICIRKVFGANVPSLLFLTTRRYFILSLIAMALITPVSYFVAKQWLNNFAVHINLDAIVFIKAAILILVITLFTVSFQSVKAALSNPARILKNE